MRTGQVLTAFASLSAITSAWTWDRIVGGAVIADVENKMVRRQDSAAGSSTITSKATTATKTTGGSSSSGTDNSSGSQSGKSSQNTSKGTKTSDDSSAETTSYDARLPPGGIQMVTPSAVAGSMNFYKVGDYVTFAWNYTSLLSTPSAIDVLATCTANSATYTIALNQSIEATSLVWDTGKYQKNGNNVPLLTNQYTLLMFDAESSVSAVPQPGRLAPYNQFTFGMYTPQPYTPFNDYICATCSAGMSQQERQTWLFLFGMMSITIVSFTWFSSNRFCVF